MTTDANEPTKTQINPGHNSDQGSFIYDANFRNYIVTRDGKVISIHTMSPLAGSISKYGYKQVTLRNNGTQKTFYVHLLVAHAFLGEKPSPLHEVNHKDGIKTNNDLDNLEWSTKSYNRYHAVNILGKRPVNSSGMDNPLNRTTPEIVAKVKKDACSWTVIRKHI